MYHIPHQLSGNSTKLFFNDYLKNIRSLDYQMVSVCAMLIYSHQELRILLRNKLSNILLITFDKGIAQHLTKVWSNVWHKYKWYLPIGCRTCVTSRDKGCWCALDGVWVSKSNWFAEENKLICWGKQIDLLSKINWFAAPNNIDRVVMGYV